MGGASRNPTEPDTTKPTRARLRWKALLGLINQQKVEPRKEFIDQEEYEGLIDELKKSKKPKTKLTGDVLQILKSQANITEKVFERQKVSARELVRERLTGRKAQPSFLEMQSEEAIKSYEARAGLRYPITREIEIKIAKIQFKNEARLRRAPVKPSFFERILRSTIIGQTLLANPRFYSLDPHVHLPSYCRRCRRPLIHTLESRFTPVGIIFAILIPILGILLLYANREFFCVVCDETYVYGDLTARPEKGSDNILDENETKKK